MDALANLVRGKLKSSCVGSMGVFHKKTDLAQVKNALQWEVEANEQ